MYYGRAKQAADEVVAAFMRPASLPRPLAQVFVRRRDGVPCRRWSWKNQLLVALHGYSDARGYRQWQQAGRQVRAGERAFHILSPVTRRVADPAGGERLAVVGFKGTPVFGYEQTEGEPLAAYDGDNEWVKALPLLDVAASWGLTVRTYPGEGTGRLGFYQRGGGEIGLGVKNLSTWVHELIHAADDLGGGFKECGQHWRSEAVAELGGAVLLRLLGHEAEADLGGCREYLVQCADQVDASVVDVCQWVLVRTCGAVALVLDTAEALRAGRTPGLQGCSPESELCSVVPAEAQAERLAPQPHDRGDVPARGGDSP
jgi:hypothetical protein